MSFKDYSLTPAGNTLLGDGTYIGPNMLRNKVRPALQQLAADGKEIADQVQDTFVAASEASASAASANLAAIAALAAGNVYATTAAGLAATAEGGYFTVAGTGDVFATLYQKVSGVAVAGPSYASKAAVDSTVAMALSLSTLVDKRLLQRLALIEDAVKPSASPVLTTGGAAWHAIYSTLRLVPTYTGPAIRGINNSGGGAVDIFFTGKGIEAGAITALMAGAAVVRLDKCYNQLGTGGSLGSDMAQTTATKRPAVMPDGFVNGALAMLIDGGLNFRNGLIDPQCGFTFTHAANGQAYTWFAVLDMNGSLSTQAPLGWDSAGGGRGLFQNDGGTANGSDSYLQHFSPAGNSSFVGKQFRSGLAVIGNREKNAPVDLLFDGVATAAVSTTDMVSAGATPTLETLTTGRFGYTSNPGLQAYNPNMRALAFLVVQGSLNDADMIAVTRWLQASFGVPSLFPYRYVRYGDSIGEGDGAEYTLGPMWWLRRSNLRGNPEIYNFSSAGRTLATLYSRRALYTQYRADMPIVYFIPATSNDLNNSVTGANAWTATKDYIAYLHGLGSNVKVVVGTILKRTDFSAGKETERVAYNALVLANADANPLRRADAICDFHAALAAVDPSYSTNAAILIDGIHPTSYGNSILAPVEAAAVNLVAP